jgi:integral membrane protein (TIGR00529 family)
MLQLVLVFALIVFFLARKWDLSYALLLGSVLLGLLFGQSIMDLTQQGVATLFDAETLHLMAAVLLIMVLGELLKAIASMKRLVRSLEALIQDSRLILPIVPALIGLLPMLGGAMFSAPLVEGIGTSLKLRPEQKTYINYWFRHIWEYVFPLYSGLVLAGALLSIPLPTLVPAQAPLTLGAIIAGALFGLREINPEKKEREPENEPASRWRSAGVLALSIWPIVLVVLLTLVFRIELALSLAATILLAGLLNRLSLRTWGGILRQGLSPRMALLVIGVMLFKRMVEATGAASTIPAAFASLGLPPQIVIFVVPFAAGLSTGMISAAVGISFPLLHPIIVGNTVHLNYAVFAFAGGFAGMLLSPLHLCLALTKDYFQAQWGPLYRMLVPSVAAVTAIAVLLLFVLD